MGAGGYAEKSKATPLFEQFNVFELKNNLNEFLNSKLMNDMMQSDINALTQMIQTQMHYLQGNSGSRGGPRFIPSN